MDLSLIGIGLVCALGAGMDALAAGLRGETRPLIRKHEVSLGTHSLMLPVYTSELDGLGRFVQASALRRIDRFSQMALLAGCLAMEDAGLDSKAKSRTATVFGLGYGALKASFDFEDSVLQFGDANPSPTLFARSVTNAVTSTVATHLKLEGPSFTITSQESTVAGVFSLAKTLLVSNMADVVLVGLGDEYHAARGYATALVSGSDFCELRPAAWEECSYIPGEGFAAFVFTRPARERPRYGRVVTQLADTEGTNDFISGQPLVIVDACGNSARSREYRKLRFAHTPEAFGHLFGAMPTGAAFDLAVAALRRRDSEESSQDYYCVSSIGPGGITQFELDDR